jgi:hypothetical protein
MDQVMKRRQIEHKQMLDQIQQVEWARQQQFFMAQRAMMEQQLHHQQAQHALAMQRMDPVFQQEQEKMKQLETAFQKATIEAEAEAWVRIRVI